MILLIGILCLLVRTVGGTCTFPVSGTFTSSHNGDVTFNSTHMEYLIGAQGGNLVFECYSTSGTKLILKSEQFPLFSSYAIAVLCMDITELKSSNLYQLQLYTSKLADANYQRVKYVTTSTTVTDAVACDDNANTETSIMMLSGSINNVIETCPTDLMGSFAYTFNDTDCLSTNGLLDICTDTSKFSFDYTTCNTVQAYSANGELNCIYTTTSGTATKLYVYNLDTSTDESTYYRFTCYMFEVTSSGTINGTQHPQDCLSTQTAYSVDSPGATVALTANYTCVPATVTPATQIATGAVAAIAIGVIIFLVIIGLIIGYLCWRAKCRKEKVEPRKGLPPTHTDDEDMMSDVSVISIGQHSTHKDEQSCQHECNHYKGPGAVVASEENDNIMCQSGMVLLENGIVRELPPMLWKSPRVRMITEELDKKGTTGSNEKLSFFSFLKSKIIGKFIIEDMEGKEIEKILQMKDENQSDCFKIPTSNDTSKFGICKSKLNKDSGTKRVKEKEDLPSLQSENKLEIDINIQVKATMLSKTNGVLSTKAPLSTFTKGYENKTSRNENRTSGNEKRTRGNENRTSGSEKRTRGNENRTSGSENKTSGSENRTSGNETTDENSEKDDLKINACDDDIVRIDSERCKATKCLNSTENMYTPANENDNRYSQEHKEYGTSSNTFDCSTYAKSDTAISNDEQMMENMKNTKAETMEPTKTAMSSRTQNVYKSYMLADHNIGKDSVCFLDIENSPNDKNENGKLRITNISETLNTNDITTVLYQENEISGTGSVGHSKIEEERIDDNLRQAESKEILNFGSEENTINSKFQGNIEQCKRLNRNFDVTDMTNSVVINEHSLDKDVNIQSSEDIKVNDNSYNLTLTDNVTKNQSTLNESNQNKLSDCHIIDGQDFKDGTPKLNPLKTMNNSNQHQIRMDTSDVKYKSNSNMKPSNFIENQDVLDFIRKLEDPIDSSKQQKIKDKEKKICQQYSNRTRFSDQKVEIAESIDQQDDVSNTQGLRFERYGISGHEQPGRDKTESVCDDVEATGVQVINFTNDENKSDINDSLTSLYQGDIKNKSIYREDKFVIKHTYATCNDIEITNSVPPVEHRSVRRGNIRQHNNEYYSESTDLQENNEMKPRTSSTEYTNTVNGIITTSYQLSNENKGIPPVNHKKKISNPISLNTDFIRHRNNIKISNNAIVMHEQNNNVNVIGEKDENLIREKRTEMDPEDRSDNESPSSIESGHSARGIRFEDFYVDETEDDTWSLATVAMPTKLEMRQKQEISDFVPKIKIKKTKKRKKDKVQYFDPNINLENVSMKLPCLKLESNVRSESVESNFKSENQIKNRFAQGDKLISNHTELDHFTANQKMLKKDELKTKAPISDPVMSFPCMNTPSYNKQTPIRRNNELEHGLDSKFTTAGLKSNSTKIENENEVLPMSSLTLPTSAHDQKVVTLKQNENASTKMAIQKENSNQDTNLDVRLPEMFKEHRPQIPDMILDTASKGQCEQSSLVKRQSTEISLPEVLKERSVTTIYLADECSTANAPKDHSFSVIETPSQYESKEMSSTNINLIHKMSLPNIEKPNTEKPNIEKPNTVSRTVPPNKVKRVTEKANFMKPSKEQKKNDNLTKVFPKNKRSKSKKVRKRRGKKKHSDPEDSDTNYDNYGQREEELRIAKPNKFRFDQLPSIRQAESKEQKLDDQGKPSKSLVNGIQILKRKPKKKSKKGKKRKKKERFESSSDSSDDDVEIDPNVYFTARAGNSSRPASSHEIPNLINKIKISASSTDIRSLCGDIDDN